MSEPTDGQILIVKNNLKNLIDLNTQLYSNGNTKILNAYLLLSLTDNKDLGLEIGLNILKGAYIALGGEFDITGDIVAKFACGLLSRYSNDTPVSLTQEFDSILLRFQATSEQLTSDFEIYYDDPKTYWNDTFTGSVTNAFGTQSVSCVFSDLATIQVPAITDSLFMDYLLACQYALDQEVWYILLGNFVITKYYPSSDYPCSEYSEEKMEQNAAYFYGKNKSYWNLWQYVHQTNRKGEDTSYYEEWQNNIGTGASAFTDGHLNDAACDYLFIDSYDNVIINSNGLFHRNFVFNNMSNITHTTHTYNN